MKVPIGWLQELVGIPLDADDLVRRLTFSGIEVESVTRLGQGLESVCVAEILAVEPHPKADRLVVCRVADGRQEVQVVCGARNFVVGDKAAFVAAGGVLPGGMRIDARAVRGVPSAGMLCAEDELGLSSDHEGILLLPRETPVGMPLAEALGLPEVVLDLEITWNRSDCLSLIGVAREVAALYGVSLHLPAVGVTPAGAPAASQASAVIEAPALCPRYTARVVREVSTGPSPVWMQRRLQRCGVRPISNIVDVTNYVMLECGQPLHAFDLERLQGGRIVVREARPGERMRTLDGVERVLAPGMLAIADAERPVALAGIMGGEGSGIDAATRHVLLESASFDPRQVHRTSVSLGLASESSHRFERGVDPELAAWASERAAALLASTAGGAVAPGMIDVYPGRRERRLVTLRFARVRSLLGVAVSDDEIVAIFEKLGLTVEARDAARCQVVIPSFRGDLEIEADLIEEVARLHGLDQVPAALPRAAAGTQVDDRRSWAAARVRERLIGLGLREVMHYSFLADKVLDRFGGGPAEWRVVLPNPVSSDHAVLRPALLPQMIQTLGYNVSHQVPDGAFFEMGRVFRQGADGRVQEHERVSFGVMGRVGRGPLDGRRAVDEAEVFGWLKGMLEALFRLQLATLPTRAVDAHPAMEPGWCVRLDLGTRVLGWVGVLRRDLRDEWRMTGPAAVAELDLGALLEGERPALRFEPLPPFPAIRHDIALLVPESVQHDDVVTTIRQAGPPELTDITLFDIFRGKATGDGRKSLAYALTYQSATRTLTDDEANRCDEAIRAALRQTLGAEIREG